MARSCLKDSDLLILASTSASRRAMFRQAGLEFETIAPEVDEAAVKRSYREREQSAEAAAAALARAKALDVALRYPDATVVGADQVLECDGVWLDKPSSLAEAAAHIRFLRGRAHLLPTAVCCARGDKILWSCVEVPQLVMRDLSDAFIDDYVAAEGTALLASVGAYRLESRAGNLFKHVQGNFFTILGLPLLPLIEFLKDFVDGPLWFDREQSTDYHDVMAKLAIVNGHGTN